MSELHSSYRRTFLYLSPPFFFHSSKQALSRHFSLFPCPTSPTKPLFSRPLGPPSSPLHPFLDNSLPPEPPFFNERRLPRALGRCPNPTRLFLTPLFVLLTAASPNGPPPLRKQSPAPVYAPSPVFFFYFSFPFPPSLSFQVPPNSWDASFEIRFFSLGLG